MPEDGIERRTCEADCDEPATHRLENADGHLFVCESCANKFDGDGVEKAILPEGRRYVYTDGGTVEDGTERSECQTDGCSRPPFDSSGYCGTCLDYIDGTHPPMTDGGTVEADSGQHTQIPVVEKSDGTEYFCPKCGGKGVGEIPGPCDRSVHTDTDQEADRR